MSHHWIMDVLRDMQTYARRNNLGRLSEQLAETLRVAADEVVVCADVARPDARSVPLSDRN